MSISAETTTSDPPPAAEDEATNEEEMEEEEEPRTSLPAPARPKKISRPSRVLPVELLHPTEDEPDEVVEPFIKKCKSLDAPLGPKVRVGKKSGEGDVEELVDEDDVFPQPRKPPENCCVVDASPHISHKKYLMINPEDVEYRPAAMTQFPLIIRQISREAHSELLKHSCQRLLPEKAKPVDPNDHPMSSVRKHYHKRESHLKVPHESMDRKLKRLKIYRRAFGSLVLYFRAYSPILFHIKKAYEDVLRFRLRQFKEAQQEKIRIFHDKVSVEVKMINYKFPDHQRLRKAEQYLNLLFVRIRKQDEAIQHMTSILSKMERSLSDHYEKYRDMEDQIKMLDWDLNDLTVKSLLPSKKHAVPEVEEGENEGEGEGGTGGGLGYLEEEAAGEAIDENEEFDEDKRVVLILAYAVCRQELDDARKKLKLYEKKFEIQRQKKRLRQGLLPGDEEEDEDEEEENEWKRMMEMADGDLIMGGLEEEGGEEEENGDEDVEDHGDGEDKGVGDGEEDDKGGDEEEETKRKGSDDLDDDDDLKLLDSDEKLDKKFSEKLDDRPEELNDKPEELDDKSEKLDDKPDD